MNNEIEDFIHQLKRLFPKGEPLHAPSLGLSDTHHVNECLKSTYVSSVGAYTEKVENRLKEITQTESAVVTSSGTSALHLCLHGIGVGPGHEVIIPDLTFVATANAVLHSAAIPHMVDIEEVSLGICPDKLAAYLSEIADVKDNKCYNKFTNRPISALILVHIFGFPAKINEILEICNRYSIPLIEDAAEGLGSKYHNQHVGRFGLVSALSFNGNKIVTSGGGGAVLSQNKEIGKRIKHVSTTAKSSSGWTYEHDEMGFNYRMPNLNAALLYGQLENLEKFVSDKSLVHQFYLKLFAKSQSVKVVEKPLNSEPNYWLNTVRLQGPLASQEQKHCLETLNKCGIGVRPPWTPMSRLKFLKSFPKMPDLSVSSKMSETIINLPSSSYLADYLSKNSL